MKLSANSSDASRFESLSLAGVKKDAFLWPSDVLEYLYCPRFIFFERVMKIPQHEELRFKVVQGREIDRKKKIQNPEYLRKKVGAVDKRSDVWMASERLHLKGRVDEVLFLEDGTAAPLDYKYAEWKERLWKNHRAQAILYGLLIEENFNVPVKKGFIVYIRSKNFLKVVEFSDRDFEWAVQTLHDIWNVIAFEKFPKRTPWRARCVDCCYRNICIQ